MAVDESISEYEAQRLANIERNKQILASLNIEKLPIASEKTAAVKKKTVSRNYTSASKGNVVAEPRVSRRKAGLEPELAVIKPYHTTSEEQPYSAEAPVIKASFDQDDRHFLDFMQQAARDSLPLSSAERVSCEQYKQLSLLATAKVTPSRVYTLAVHPTVSKTLVAAGDKYGHLGIWDVEQYMRAAQNDPKTKDGIYQLRPFKDTICSLRYNADGSQLFMASYEDRIKVMDVTTESFNCIFDKGSSKDTKAVICSMELYGGNEVYYSDTSGTVGFIDLRSGDNRRIELHEAKIGVVHKNPIAEQYLLTASNDRTVKLWDARKLSKISEAFQVWEAGRAVTSAYFDPIDGTRIVSSCYDDFIRLHTDVLTNPSADPLKIIHNNQTGAWISPFRAIWDPKPSQSVPCFAIGNMKKWVDVYSGDNGRNMAQLSGEKMTAQPAVNAFHPKLNQIISGNATGKVHIFI